MFIWTFSQWPYYYLPKRCYFVLNHPVYLDFLCLRFYRYASFARSGRPCCFAWWSSVTVNVILLHQHFFFHLVNHVISRFNMRSVAMLCSAVTAPRVTLYTSVSIKKFVQKPADWYVLPTNFKTYCKNVMTYYKFWKRSKPSFK